LGNKKKKKTDNDNPVLANNRSASHEYLLIRRLEAGIVLHGPEVKSARERRVNLKEAYARITGGEIFLHQAHFNPYSHARLEEADPVRPRKLLLHALEIRKLAKDLEGTSMTLVPTKLYLKNGRIKVEIALAKGKQNHDKRESMKKRDVEREIRQAHGSRTVD
jgi:SsrA-binding protein